MQHGNYLSFRRELDYLNIAMAAFPELGFSDIGYRTTELGNARETKIVSKW